MSKFQKIVIVKNRALGDSIIGLAGVHYLRELFPNAKITYVVPSWVAPLYKNISVECNEVVGIDFKKISDLLFLWKKLKANKTDVVYEMHQSGSSRNFFKSYAFFSRCKYCFHNHHLKASRKCGVIDQGVIKSNIQRDLDGIYSAFSRKLNLDTIPSFLDYVPHVGVLGSVKQTAVNFKKIIVGVVATRKTKMWPLSSYVNLIEKIKITSKINNLEIIIPLSGSAVDRMIEEELVRLNVLKYAKIAKEKLENLPLLFNEALFYIGNDTGLKHLAVALDIPTFTFFGPEDPMEWHPYDLNKHKVFFIKEMPCRTALSHYCGLEKCDHSSCLNQISVDEVFSTISIHL